MPVLQLPVCDTGTICLDSDFSPYQIFATGCCDLTSFLASSSAHAWMPVSMTVTYDSCSFLLAPPYSMTPARLPFNNDRDIILPFCQF
jgi:hypothetical protein